jgi:tetratricopeptide (TPR) repeat protein
MNQRRGAEAKPPHAKITLRSQWFLGLLLVAATVLAYQPVWQAGFIWDDDAYITLNRLLSAPDGLRRIWFSEDSPSQYFPLVYTSFRFEHALWGFNPAGYHLLNILLHASNALLVWRVLGRLKLPGAWLAAALFALHPVQVETVAWVTERKNVLSLLFFLLALLGWVGFTREPPAHRWRYYTLALLFYLLALLSKTTACTLPAALVLVLWVQKKPIDRSRVAQIAPFVGIGLAMGLFTMWWERHHLGIQEGAFALGLRERLLIASHAVWFYLGKLVWPANLAFSYPRWMLQPGNLLSYGWLLAGILLCGLVYRMRRKLGRGPETALLFYVATLAPALGFFMLFMFRYTFVADHYQYVACIGPLALAAAGLATARDVLVKRGTQPAPVSTAANRPSQRTEDPRRVSGSAPSLDWRWVAVCVVGLLCLGTLTWRQARVYKNAETLWRDTVAKNPTSWLARSNLGRYLLHEGQFDGAMEQYLEVLRINPRDADCLVSVGNALFGRGRYDEAVGYYQQALKVNPNSPEAHANLAVILANQGKIDEAIEHDRQALVGNPNHITAHSNLAVLLARQGRYAEAMEHYEKVLAINPNQPLTHINLALVLNSLGRTNEARAHYLKAAEIVNRHAGELAQQGRLDAAAAQYRELIKILPGSPEAHYGLGLVLERQGKRPEAREEFSEALRLKPYFPEADRELKKLGGIQIIKQ